MKERAEDDGCVCGVTRLCPGGLHLLKVRR